MTTRRGKPRNGDAMVGVRESKGDEEKGEYSWKVTLVEVT